MSNLRNAGGYAIDRYNAYVVWANETAGRLAHLLSPEDVGRLVTTRRHWMLLSIDPVTYSSPALASLVSVEIDERLRAFELARRDLDVERQRWLSRPGRRVIADTNVYLHHERYFDEIPWPTVFPDGRHGVFLVVPLVVIDELERHKRSPRNAKVSDTNEEAVRTRARVSIKRLNELLPEPGSVGVVHPAERALAGTLKVGLLLDDPHHVRLSDVDSEIVDRASSLQDLTGQIVYIATFDTGMRMRARAAGLEVIQLPEVEPREPE